MSKGDDTRDRILDAFEALVLEHGERAGTLAATAGAAGVSKGGLLYHFGSKAKLDVDAAAASALPVTFRN